MSEDTQQPAAEEKTDVIEVKSQKSDRTVEFEKSFGDSLQDAINLYGEEVVFTIFRQQAIIKCQAKVRNILDKGGKVEDAIAAGQNYAPGVVTRTRIAADPFAQLANKVKTGKMTKEELRAQLEAQLEALGVE